LVHLKLKIFHLLVLSRLLLPRRVSSLETHEAPHNFGIAPCALASDSMPTLVYLAVMARESCPTSSITTLSGTPASLRIETALCRKEWKLISIP
jgi:hypothetical protein